MSQDDAALEPLTRHVTSIATATSAADVLSALFEGSAAVAPRAVLFLLRGGFWKGWRVRGYPPGTGERLAAMTLPARTGWPGEPALDALGPESVLARTGEGLRFGQDPAAESMALPVRVGRKTAALLLIERNDGEQPWRPSLASALSLVARLRLTLDALQRRAGAPAEDARRETPDFVSPRVAAPAAMPAPTPATRDSLAAEPTELAPAEAPKADPAEAARWDEARRFARLIATDIRLYNEEAVLQGRRSRDLGRRLAEQLERGREAFARRFGELGTAGERILAEAYASVLGGGDASLFASVPSDPIARR